MSTLSQVQSGNTAPKNPTDLLAEQVALLSEIRETLAQQQKALTQTNGELAQLHQTVAALRADYEINTNNDAKAADIVEISDVNITLGSMMHLLIRFYVSTFILGVVGYIVLRLLAAVLALLGVRLF